MNDYQASLEALTKNIKTAVRRMRREGVVAMAKKNLRQVVSTSGVTVHPTAFDRLLDEAIATAKLPRGFIYE